MEKTKKQIIEEKFHDHYASSTSVKDINVAENFSYAAQENRKALKVFGKLTGKNILDLGCGFGETAVFWAKKGALVEAIDISSESISIANKLAKRHKVSNRCNFQQMTAENLNYKNEYFDFVFGNGVLHHVELLPSLKEIKRVLKKDGKAVFVEPLAYNPIINVYRNIADEVRTPTERPLTFKKIKNMKDYFKKVDHQEYQLFTLIIFIWFFIFSRINPNKERYWRKILQVKGTLKIILKILISIDNKILRLISPFRYLCWNTVIILTK